MPIITDEMRENGVRPKCFVEGCNRQVAIRWDRGYYEVTCWKHAKDGTLRPSATKQAIRNYNLWNQRGITFNDRQVMFEEQDGRCAICGREESEFSRPLGVDHNHKTGQIRKLLCNHCNSVVGIVETQMDLVKKAEMYLAEYQGT